MVNIITDSTCDLGPELAAQRNIRVVPLYVFMNNQTYTDGVNINLRMLFDSVTQTGELPKTSAPTVPDFQKAFEMPGESVYIGVSSKLSVTMQNALLAQQTFPEGKVYVVDSRNLSTGIGLLALKAADLRDQGLSAKAIAEQITALVPNVQTSFVIETLEFLYKGGRCSAMQNLMSSLLHIRPVIAVREDGTLGVKAKTRGARQKALVSMIDSFCEDLPKMDRQRVFITHTGCDQDALFLKEAIKKAAQVDEIFITYAGSVVGSHCGPDTIGILYLLAG